MDEVANWLAHELRLLERVLFKLIEERHLLAAGEARFLGLAAAEVQRATGRLGEAQLRRSMLLDARARELGVPELTLATLAMSSPEPYRTIFEDQRREFVELVAEIDEVSAHNRRRAEIGVKLAELDGLDECDFDRQLADIGYQVVAGSSLPAGHDFLS